MNAGDREWHLNHLRDRARLRVICLLAVSAEPRTVGDLAALSGHSTSTVRNALDHALHLGWVYATEGPSRPTGRRSVLYRLTGLGRQEVAALTVDDSLNDSSEPGPDRPSSTDDAAAIVVDDHPSSSTKTAVNDIIDRRGKPSWCTPNQPCTICGRTKETT